MGRGKEKESRKGEGERERQEGYEGCEHVRCIIIAAI